MEQHPLHSLVRLIEFDRQITAQEQQAQKLHTQIAAIEKNLQKLELAKQQSEKRVFSAQKMVHEHEAVMKDLEAGEQTKKELLEKTQSSKEYESIKKEITYLKKRQYDHEKEVVRSWKDLETAQKELSAYQTQYTSQATALHEQQTQKRAAIQTIESAIKKLNEERIPLEKQVPEELRAQYSRMRASSQNPMVPVEYDSCSGCFAQLSAQDLLDLKRNKLIQCRSCYRFVYLTENMPPAEPGTAA